MAMTTGADYKYIDVVNGSNTTRHYMNDSAARGMIAPEFAEATANAAGTYVTYDGGLYYLPEGHTANATWANTTKTAATVGGDVGDLKSAVNEFEGDKTKALWEVVKRIGAFTGTDGANVVSAFKTAWGAYDVIEITGVEVSGNTSLFVVGETRQLAATLTPTITAPDQYEAYTVAWSSSNTSVATVNSTGLVSAVSDGNARITCTVTANSGTYTDYVDVTITAEQTPLYTLPQGSGNYPSDYGSLTISGNSVTFNCTHHTGAVKLNLALLPDGTYYANTFTPNTNSLFSIAQGDEMTIEVYDISYQFPNADDGDFSFCLMDENNSGINNAGKQPIYRTTRPEGTSVSGTLAANRNAEVHGLRAYIYTYGVGSVSFKIKVYINGTRYY